MSCKRCENDIQPANFASPRKCAFLESGEFTPDNWNCATISELLKHSTEHCGDDETMQVISVPNNPDPDWEFEFGTNGWIILTRYKHHGETSFALHVTRNGSEPLTLALAEQVISAQHNVAKFNP